MKCERCNDARGSEELDWLCLSCHEYIFEQFLGTMQAYDDVDEMGQK